MNTTTKAGGAQAPPVVLCRHRQGGEIKPVTIGLGTIYAGGGMHFKKEDEDGFDLIINLRDETISPEILFGERGGKYLFLPIQDLQTVPENVVGVIPIFGWELLQTYCRIVEGKRVLVFCAGGHGRTGLFLASLLVMAEPEVNDPVAEIRNRYCPRAVETPAQEAQVARMHEAARGIHQAIKGA